MVSEPGPRVALSGAMGGGGTMGECGVGSGVGRPFPIAEMIPMTAVRAPAPKRAPIIQDRRLTDAPRPRRSGETSDDVSELASPCSLASSGCFGAESGLG